MSLHHWTNWLRQEEDLIASRLALLIRDKGINPKTVICAKIFPDIKDPTGGVLITPQGNVYQFGFNRAGMLTEMASIDVWLNITQTYRDHPWRDEIMEGLTILDGTK